MLQNCCANKGYSVTKRHALSYVCCIKKKFAEFSLRNHYSFNNYSFTDFESDELLQVR